MKDIKTKEVTTKPKTKNPASRIPKELMRTAILESKEKPRPSQMPGTMTWENSPHPNMPVGKSHPQRNGLQERQAEL